MGVCYILLNVSKTKMNNMNQLKPLVENRVLDLMAEAEQRYNLNEIRFPKILFNLKGKCGGQFVSGGPKDRWDLRINMEALTKYTDHYVKETIGHEVAHLVAKAVFGARHHDYLWKRVMRDYGLAPTRCHTYDLTPARRVEKFEYKCGCLTRTHKVGKKVHNKIQMGMRYTCSKCRCKLVSLSSSAGPDGSTFARPSFMSSSTL
jgi:SprT protein